MSGRKRETLDYSGLDGLSTRKMMRRYMSPDLSVSELMEDLADVTDWHSLGTHLGLESRQLNVIEQEIPAGVGMVERRKRRVLDTWMKGKTDDPECWDVWVALKEMGEKRVAHQMSKKYGLWKFPDHPSLFSCIVSDANEAMIKDRFVQLQTAVSDNVQRKQDTKRSEVRRFSSYMTGLLPPGQGVADTANVQEVFRAASESCVWGPTNYQPLVRVAKMYGEEDPDLTEELEAYPHDVVGYKLVNIMADNLSDTPVLESEDEDESPPPPVRKDRKFCRLLKVKLGIPISVRSLEYVDELWNSLSEEICLPSPTAVLEKILKA